MHPHIGHRWHLRYILRAAALLDDLDGPRRGRTSGSVQVATRSTTTSTTTRDLHLGSSGRRPGQRGIDLFEYIDAEKEGLVISEAEARGIFRQVVGALKHIHDQDVIHGDIKPENVMVIMFADPLKELQVKLIDFGFAAVDNAFQAAAAPGSASADHGAANGARNGAASHLADGDANGADTPGAGGPATPACTSTSTARTMVRPTEATMHGSVMSMVAAAFMGLLFIVELNVFMSSNLVTKVAMDNNMASQLRVNFNITVHDLHCASLRASRPLAARAPRAEEATSRAPCALRATPCTGSRGRACAGRTGGGSRRCGPSGSRPG